MWRCCWLLSSSALLVFCARGSSAMFSPNIITRKLEKILPDISGWINGTLDCLVLQLSRETPTLIFLKYPIFSYKAWSHENNSLSRCLNQTNNCFRLLEPNDRSTRLFPYVSSLDLNNCSHFEEKVNRAYWFLLKWCHHLCFLIINQSVWLQKRLDEWKKTGGWVVD